jgi:hypothetical protein
VTREHDPKRVLRHIERVECVEVDTVGHLPARSTRPHRPRRQPLSRTVRCDVARPPTRLAREGVGRGVSGRPRSRSRR